MGLVYKVYNPENTPGKFFPYRAHDWGGTSMAIPHFAMTATPVMGDIWSNGHHTGIYIGKELYISARNDADHVFGVIAGAQKEHGIQIKVPSRGWLVPPLHAVMHSARRPRRALGGLIVVGGALIALGVGDVTGSASRIRRSTRTTSWATGSRHRGKSRCR